MEEEAEKKKMAGNGWQKLLPIGLAVREYKIYTVLVH